MENVASINEKPINFISWARMNHRGLVGETESSAGRRGKAWNSLVTVLTSLPPDEPHWLYKTPFECLLVSKNGEGFKPLRRFREETFELLRERVIERLPLGKDQKEVMVFLTERYTRRQSLFKIRYLSSLDKEMVQIERTRTFSKEEFIKAYPRWGRMFKDLEAILDKYPRLILGGRESPFIKKCCYSIIMERVEISEFPPPLFIEENIEVHLPKVLQLLNAGKEGFCLELFEGIEFPFLFYESRDSLFLEERSFLNNFLISSKNFVLCLPFSSPEAMEKTLSERKDKTPIGFKTFFLSPLEIREL